MPALSKPAAVACFVTVLLSYSAQSELAQLVQRSYQKPVFLLWCTHSGYMLIAPLHLLALKVYGVDIRSLGDRLHSAISEHCNVRATSLSWAQTEDELLGKRVDRAARLPIRELLPAYIKMIIVVTVSITVPALSWYCAVPLTTMTDITCLYNSNAFWAYLLTVYLLRTEELELRKGCAVVLACIGVVTIAYGDAQAGQEANAEKDVASRLAGSALAFFGSLTYAFYEVYYSRFIALGEAPVAGGVPSRVATQHNRQASGRYLMSSPRTNRKLPPNGYTGVPSHEDEGEEIEVIARGASAPSSPIKRKHSDLPPPPEEDQAVMLAYANFVTASIGALTLLVLWIPLPILHWIGWEAFELPPDLRTAGLIFAMVLCGVFYNAGFMVLLGQWGPIIASVGNLCTLVLVAAADVVFVGANLTFPTLLGSAFIVGAFSVLAVS